MPVKRRTGSNKNAPFFSHEFFIQNHPDIVSCIAMVFVIGLLFQTTAPLASPFIVMSHNVTDIFEDTTAMYTYGLKDLALIFFYFLILIVVHAVIQEYFLDKLNRKLHLSKIKHNKFNESGQLLIFYLVSVAWGVEIIRREGYLFSISKLWIDYPHTQMTYLFKFYFIVQIAYWIHSYPELYFQKVKREEIGQRLTYSTLYLVFIITAYILNFNRIALCLSVLHYFVEALFHCSRLFYFADKTQVSDYGFKLWNILFVFVRLTSITLSVLTFWYGLAANFKELSWSEGNTQENKVIQETTFSEGNFNTQIVRINCLLALCFLQTWMMWNFITFHLKRMRERELEAQQQRKKQNRNQAKKSSKKSDDDVNELPEVDQNTKKLITQRHSTKSGKVKH